MASLTLACLVTSACTHQEQFYLLNRGELVISNAGEEVRISRKYRVFVEWTSDGGDLSTTVLRRECKDGVTTDREVPVTTHVVEASAQYIHLSSGAWNSLSDLPESYNAPGSGVQILGMKNPGIVLPTADLGAICLYKRELTSRELVPNGTSVLLAAGLGAAASTVGRVAWCVIDEEEREEERQRLEDMKARDFLTAAGLGAMAGAVVYSAAYPIYRCCRAWFGEPSGSEVLDYSRCYPLGEGEGTYTIKIVANHPGEP